VIQDPIAKSLVHAMVLCSKCFNKSPAEKGKDGEWVESVGTNSERRSNPSRPPRTSVKYENLRKFVMEDQKQPSIRWAEDTANKNKRVSVASQASDKVPNQWIAREISVGSYFSDDSISKALGVSLSRFPRVDGYFFPPSNCYFPRSSIHAVQSLNTI